MTQKSQILNLNILNIFKFESQIRDGKIKQKGLVDKSAISGFIKNDDLDKKVGILVKEVELKAE